MMIVLARTRMVKEEEGVHSSHSSLRSRFRKGNLALVEAEAEAGDDWD